MAATLTINLKDNATPGLQELEQQLAQTGKATGEVATDTRQLTAAQKDQIKVIHEHRAAWSQLAASVGPSLLNLSASVGAMGVAWYQSAKQAQLVSTVYAELQQRTVGLAVAKKGLEIGATRAIGILTRMGPAVGLTVAAYKTLTFVLDNTGRRAVSVAEDFSAATEQQIADFNALADAANKAGLDIDTAMAQAGKTWADFGAKVTTSESNLDRLKASGANLGTTVARSFREAAAAAYELVMVGELNLGIYDAIDARVTRWADQTVENIDAVSTGYGKLIDQARAAAAAQLYGNGDRYLEEIEQLRELESLHENLNEQRENEQEYFARLKSANAQLAAQRESNAESERLRGLDTLAAIDGEISRQKDLAGQKASALQFDEQAQAAYLARLNQLEQQRTQIVRAEAGKRKQLLQEIREENEQRERESLELRAANEADALRRSVDRYNQWASDVRASQERLNDFAQDYADQSNNAILNNLITRLDAEGNHTEEAHTARKKLIQQETDQRIAAADTQEERERAFYDGLMRLQREELAHNQRVIREEVATRKQAAEETLRIEKAKKDELTRLLQDAGGPSGKDLLGQIDPRKALQDQRGKAAADSARNRVLNDPRNQQLRNDALTSVEANNRLKRMQEQAARQAERDARAGAFRDFNRGKADPREIAQAQSQTGQQLLQTMGQNGKLSGDVVQILQQQLQAAADQQGTLSRLEQQVAQLQRASQVVGNGARAQRQRAQQGSVQ